MHWEGTNGLETSLGKLEAKCWGKNRAASPSYMKILFFLAAFETDKTLPPPPPLFPILSPVTACFGYKAAKKQLLSFSKQKLLRGVNVKTASAAAEGGLGSGTLCSTLHKRHSKFTTLCRLKNILH